MHIQSGQKFRSCRALLLLTLYQLYEKCSPLPQQVVSDNGPQFTSELFAHFMAVNGVKHIRTSPYHPASNGAAERLVQTAKQGLRSALRKGVSLDQALRAFLLRYRTTPQATTGVSPSVLMFGRNIRTQLDLLRPEVGVRVSERQEQQQQRHNQHCQHRELSLEQLVWVRNWRAGARWLKAKVQKQLGPLTYLVQLENGECWRRHIDHLRVRYQSLLSEQSLLEEGPAAMDESNSETENMEHKMKTLGSLSRHPLVQEMMAFLVRLNQLPVTTVIVETTHSIRIHHYPGVTRVGFVKPPTGFMLV